MADKPAPNESTQDGKTTGEPTSGAGGEFTPITSQEEFNRRLASRLDQQRRQFADYDDLKAKAAKWEQAEAANKSEIEKAYEAKAAAEAERDAARAEALRFKVASKYGISDEQASLLLTGTDEATLTRQAEALAQWDSDRKKNGNVAPREGANQSAGNSDQDATTFVRQLFTGD